MDAGLCRETPVGEELRGGVTLGARQLEGVGRITRNQFLLRLKVDDYEVTLFPDGRAIIGGTDDVAVAKTVYAKYIGN